MRTLSKGVLVLGLLLAITAPLMAQGRGGGGGKNKAALSVSVTPESFSESDAGATGRVTRENSDTSVALMVTVTSSDGTEALVSASDSTEPTVSAIVEVPVGQVSTTFNVIAFNDTDEDGSQAVTILAEANGHSDGSASTWDSSTTLLPSVS